MKRYTIDPITRLEGHGKIEIFCTDEGEVDNVYFQVPELRGLKNSVKAGPSRNYRKLLLKFVVCAQDATTWPPGKLPTKFMG
jgi:F420-non-reducing hydrogenase large subunit